MSKSYISLEKYPFALNHGRTIYSSATRLPRIVQTPDNLSIASQEDEEQTQIVTEDSGIIKRKDTPVILRDLCPPHQEPYELKKREAIVLWEDPCPPPPSGSCFPPSVFSSLEPPSYESARIPTWVSAFSCPDIISPEWAPEDYDIPSDAECSNAGSSHGRDDISHHFMPYSPSSSATSRDSSPFPSLSLAPPSRRMRKPYHRYQSENLSDSDSASDSSFIYSSRTRNDKKRVVALSTHKKHTTPSQSHSGRTRCFPCPITGCTHACYSQADLARHLSSLAHSAAAWPCRSLGCEIVLTRPDARKRHEQNKHPKERFEYQPKEGLVRVRFPVKR